MGRLGGEAWTYTVGEEQFHNWAEATRRMYEMLSSEDNVVVSVTREPRKAQRRRMVQDRERGVQK